MQDIFDTIAIPKKDIFDRISLPHKKDIFDTLGTPIPQPLPPPTRQEQLAKESNDYGFNLLTGTASEAGKEAYSLAKKTFSPFDIRNVTNPIAEVLSREVMSGKPPIQAYKDMGKGVARAGYDTLQGLSHAVGDPLGTTDIASGDLTFPTARQAWTERPYESAVGVSPILTPLLMKSIGAIPRRQPEIKISPEAKQAYTSGIQEIGQTLKNIPDKARPAQARVVADLRNQMRSALFKDDVATINSIVADFREGQTIPTAQPPQPTLRIPSQVEIPTEKKEIIKPVQPLPKPENIEIVKPQPKGFTPIEAAPVVSKEPWQLPIDKIEKSDYELKPLKTIGYRYGAAPESGYSYNSMTGKNEKGASLASAGGLREVKSFAVSSAEKRGKSYYEGDIIGYGGDDEPIMNNLTKISKREYENKLNSIDTKKAGLSLAINKLRTAEILANRGYLGYTDEVVKRLDIAKKLHLELIKQAQLEGKPIPPEVLKDYPELQKTHIMPSGEVMPGAEHATGIPSAAKPIQDELLHNNTPITKIEAKSILAQSQQDYSPKAIKQHKEYLFGRIDEAIKDAKDYEVEPVSPSTYENISQKEAETTNKLKAAGESVGFVTIEVPGDGKFRIINSKQALTKFKNDVVSKFPTTKISTTQKIEKAPLGTVADKAIGLDEAMEGTYESKPIHGNGDIILFTPLKIKPKSYRLDPTGDRVPIPERLNDLIDKKTSHYNVDDIVFIVQKADEAEGVSNIPLPHLKEDMAIAELYAGDKHTFISQKYYNYIKAHFPDATFKIADAEKAVQIYSNKKLVGLVMPLELPTRTPTKSFTQKGEIVKEPSDIFDKLEFNPEQGFRRQPLTPEAQKEVVKKSGIVKLLQQKLDVPIRYGRFRDKALGIFKVRPEIIRTRFANDIETVSHEIGHALQKYLFPESLTKQGLSGKIFQEYQKELISIASKPKAGQAKTPEGFAEFIRLYITNESQAQVKTPKFYNYFDNFLKTNHLEISEIFAEARNRYNRYLTQTPEQRKISQISIGEKQPKTKEPFKEFYTKFLDELYPLRKVVQEMAGGKEIPVIQDPYKLARLMPGIAGKVDSFLEYKPFDYKTYTFYGKSLKEILNQIPKDRLDLYRAYQISKSEYESYQKKGIVADPISIEDSKFIIDKYEAEFGKVFKENVAFRDAVLRYFKDAGMLSRETYKSFKELFENYVPLYRVMDTEGVGGTGKPLEAYQFIKQRRGSWRDFIDPIESDIKNLYAMITLAEKNGVTTALVDLANSKQGMGKYVEKIPTPMQKIMVKTDEVMNQLSADPVFAEMIKEFTDLPEAVSIFRKSAFTPKENIISNWRNGKQSLYQVHPDIARTIQALDRESINTVIKILSYPARWLRAGAVLSPEFIGRNPIRDQFSAFIYSKYGFVPGYDLVKGIFHLAKKGGMYWTWKISGAEHSMLVSVDREYLQKTANAVVENRKIFNIEHVKDIIRNPIETLRALSEIGESGTRIGEFTKGIKKDDLSKEGILEAGYNAREVTLDFGKSGAYSKAINMLIAFWNAHNLGIDKTIRAFKDNPYTTTWKVAASITLPSIILTLVNSQDERWKEIPRWQKDLFWIVMTKNHIWRIPKPFELGILFGTVPERITEYIISRDKNAFQDVYKSILQGLSPNVLPTVAVPIVENWANRSIFLDRPIVPMGKVNLPPQYQYQPYTTGVAKTLGRLISKIPKLGETAIASPAKIENLIRGWTGGLGFHVLKLSDYALRKSGVIDKSVMPSKTMADIPFIKAFAVRYPSADANSIQDFYDRYETNSQKLNAVKQLLKEGRIEEAKQLQGKGIVKDTMSYKALNNMNQTISNIYMNKKMPPEEKRNLIDSIYLQMIEITKYSNKQNPQIGR